MGGRDGAVASAPEGEPAGALRPPGDPTSEKGPEAGQGREEVAQLCPGGRPRDPV